MSYSLPEYPPEWDEPEEDEITDVADDQQELRVAVRSNT